MYNFFDAVRSGMKLQTENIYSSLSKEDQKFIERICHVKALKIDKWKTFSTNYKLIRVWLWFAYKSTKNVPSTALIQIQKKVSYLPTSQVCQLEEYLSTRAKNVFVNWTPQKTTPSKVSYICRCGFKRTNQLLFLLKPLKNIWFV